MAMRLSGLMSGMDTESLISQLVEARKPKVDKAKKAQTKLGWQQEAWKSLNTKLKNLQSKYISNMRFSTAYSKKVTKVSNSSAVSVITGENAVNGVQSLEIDQLAKTGYLTGAELKAKDAAGQDTNEKGNYTAMTTLRELGFDETGSFNIKTGNNSIDVKVDGSTTISDVLNKLKEAGLNANFDARSQRFFVSAKESGEAADFSITASDAKGANALAALGLQTGLTGDENKIDKATLAQYRAYASYANGASDDDDIRDNMRDLIDTEVEKRRASYEKQYNSLLEKQAAANTAISDTKDEIREKYGLNSLEDYAARIQTLQNSLDGNVYTDDAEKEAAEKQLKDLQEASEKITAQQTVVDTTQREASKLVGENGPLKIVSEEVDGEMVTRLKASDTLQDEVAGEFVEKAKYAKGIVDTIDSGGTIAGSGATKVSGQNARIYLNGAEFTNSSNVFEVNGLTFTALSETKPGESITVTTQQDTDGIYDMVKNFLKEYNSIINEMDKLYNADSAKGYEPLTSEEKEAMSETEITEYEKKIKDALLRKDSNLSDISSAMRSAMSAGVEVNGKKMYLFDFGIDLLGYFNAADNEKNAYHIDGDPDDADTAGKADKLKGLISSDPDTVISFFTKLSQNLYDKMSNMSKSIEGYRSFGSFYDDKKMKADYNSYNSKIKDLEDKLNAYEDSWYKKFAKMETTMAKMQKNTNALSGLLGGS